MSAYYQTPQNMLERETETIIQTLVERTIGSARSLALKDALAAEIPKSVKSYLRSEVSRLMGDDLQNAGHFSNLPFASPIVHRLTRSYVQTLAVEYIFSREGFIDMLQNGVHFVENYICRPQWTLEQFVFEKRDRISLLDLQTRLAYLCEYLYFGKLVEGYMRQKALQEIGSEEFRKVITKIDEQVMRQHNARELAQLTQPVFEFFLLQTEISHKPIPVKPLLVFFEDKKMGELKVYIESVCHVRSTEQLSIEQLAAIIDDHQGGGVRQSQAERKREPPPSTPPDQTPTVEEKLKKTIPVADPENGLSDMVVPESAKRNIALSLTYSGMTETGRSPSSLPIKKLGETITEEQRGRFVHTIFRGDETYYKAVVDTLDSLKTWSDASLYLDAFYQTSGVDPTLADVVEFTDAVQLRYSLAPHS